jgi:hypothetical protein
MVHTQVNNLCFKGKQNNYHVYTNYVSDTDTNEGWGVQVEGVRVEARMGQHERGAAWEQGEQEPAGPGQ